VRFIVYVRVNNSQDYFDRRCTRCSLKPTASVVAAWDDASWVVEDSTAAWVQQRADASLDWQTLALVRWTSDRHELDRLVRVAGEAQA
jgi:hypothetical protein